MTSLLYTNLQPVSKNWKHGSPIIYCIWMTIKLKLFCLGLTRKLIWALLIWVHFPLITLLRSRIWASYCDLKLNKQINSTVSASFYHLRRLAKVKPFLSRKSFEIIIHAFISSRLDYCNSLYYGLPVSSIHRLQLVQNAAARLLTKYCTVKNYHDFNGKKLWKCYSKNVLNALHFKFCLNFMFFLWNNYVSS